jgi:hypothetical protein
MGQISTALFPGQLKFHIPDDCTLFVEAALPSTPGPVAHAGLSEEAVAEIDELTLPDPVDRIKVQDHVPHIAIWIRDTALAQLVDVD